MCVNIFIGGIITKVIPHKEISQILDRVIPGEPQLIVSLVEFGLKRPLKVELEVVVFFEGRSIAYLSAHGAGSVAVDILLNSPKQRAFFISLDIDTWIVVGIRHAFNPLLDNELILTMLELPNLQLLFALS